MPADPSRHRFGPFELDLGTMRLLRQGQPLKLPRRALMLLAHLVERRHRVLTKAELLELLAPQHPTDVSELARQISVLRRLLGEEAVATAPGRGWQFMLPLLDDQALGALHLNPARLPDAAGTGTWPGEHRRPPLRPLYGREADLAALAAMLPERRLLSVVGREGVGKSQLVAHLFAHRPGVVWVDLSHLAAEPAAALASREWTLAALAHAVAAALGARHRAADPMADLTHALRLLDVPSLWLVFDETSQLALPPGLAAELSQTLLAASPALRLLWTATLPLELGGESVYRLHGLPSPALADAAHGTPAGGADHPPLEAAALTAALRQSAATRVLLAQARRFDPSYTVDLADPATAVALAALLQVLEGLPMALELAGARLPALGAPRLLQELRQHRSARGERGLLLHGVMDWTLARLTGDEHELLRRLGRLLDHRAGLPATVQGPPLPPGSFALDDLAARGTTGAAAVADTLDALADLALVQLVPGEGGVGDRFRVLGAWRSWERQHAAPPG